MHSVIELITSGESKFLEFKQEYATSMLKTVSAFANEHDGRILFGVTDHGKCIGIQDIQHLRLKIENAINDNIQPRPFYEIDIQKVDGNDVLILKVYQGEYTPYYYQNKAYVRSDTASIEVDRIRLNQMILAGQNIHFEELTASNQTLTFLTLERLMRQRLKIGILNADLLKSLSLIKKDQYNNAAALLSDQNPIEESEIALLAFGPEIVNLTDRQVLKSQSVLDQFEASILFWQKHTHVSEKITGVYRQTVEEIPLVAYREAVSNAIVHRDYQLRGQIKVEFYQDRVEITSPGTLPPGISKEEYLDGRLSIPRNRILADIFQRLGIIERLATGIRRIKENYQGREKQPTFLINENSITVILPRATDTTETIQSALPIDLELSDDEKKIMEQMHSDRAISRREVGELLSLGKTRTYQLINGLVLKHLIYPVGSGRNTRYKKLFR